MPQFAFRLSGDPEHATVLSSAAPVVVACRPTLALFAFVGWCWGWGVGTKNFVQAFCGVRCSSRMLHLGHAAHVATGSARFAGFRPPAGTAFSLLFCGLPFLRPQSGARQLVRLLLFGRPHFLLLSGHPTTCCSDCSLSSSCSDWA